MQFTVGRAQLNHYAATDSDTQAALDKQQKETKSKAEANLDQARGSTRWHKIHGPDHLTQITASEAEGEYGSIDRYVNLEAPNPMAIEYGHSPSGVFGPGGSLGHLDTKSPDGLYILTRAAAGI